MRRFESEFALTFLNKIQIADRDGFPTQRAILCTGPTQRLLFPQNRG